MGAKLGAAGHRAAIVDINITPFVDIVLVILIIFMVTSQVMSTRKELPVTLPEAASGESADAETSIAIVILPDGTLLLDGRPSTLPDLRSRLRREHADGNPVTCLLSGDRDARHGAVVDVLDALRLEGVSNFAFEITPVTP